MPSFPRGFCLTLVWMLLLPAGVLCAQDAVEEVTVTGRLHSLAVPSRPLEVVTAAEIRALGVTDLAGLLDAIPSLQVSRRGPGDTSFDLGLRGSNFEQVLVLVNGIPVNHSQTGHFTMDLPFSPDDIERVEVLKGGAVPARASGAFAGAVNIVLKTRDRAGLTLSGGEHGLLGLGLSAGAGNESLSGRLSLKSRRNDGFYPGRESRDLCVDGGLHYGVSGLTVDLFAGGGGRRFGADGFYGPWPSLEHTNSAYVQLHVERRFSRLGLLMRASWRRHGDDFILDREDPDGFVNHSVTREGLVSLGLDWRTEAARIAMGAEYRGEFMDSEVMGARRRDLPALYFTLSLPPGIRGTGADAGLRLEFPDGKAGIVAFAGLYARVAPDLVLRGGVSRTLRRPSFTELYYDSPANRGDPRLRPESGLDLETCLEYRRGNRVWTLEGFLRRRHDLIDWVRFPGESRWRALNLADHTLAGLGVTWALHMERADLRTGVEGILAGRLDAPGESKYGLRFPDLAVKMNALWHPSRRVSLCLRYVYKQIFHSLERGHFLDFCLGVRPARHLEVSLRLDNLLDMRMEEVPGVPVAGRWISLSLAWRPM